MLFSSLTFLFIFLPLTLLIYFISDKKYKNSILLFFSLIFYSWGEPRYIILILVSIIFNYYFAIFIEKTKSNRRKKEILILTLIFNVGMLFVFKYLNFFAENIANLLNLPSKKLNIILPIGISFYTFQILSYIIDVYQKKVKVQKNIFNLGTYILLFPQLIAGPIVRYSTIEEELNSRTHSIEKFCDGFRRFIIGLSKKVIIANNVALIADTIFNSAVSNHYGGFILIIGTLAYTFQIYFDFSGYSDMAIGLGKMFGFEFLENFNYPYISQSITDFWRRWHISLSSFFRDYIYIPLGGNKVSRLKWIRNILIVWALTGLWHGAEWNFIIWGIYFALILLVEKLFFNKVLEKTPKIFRWTYSFILINIGWLIFRVDNVNLLIHVFKNLLVFDNNIFKEFLLTNFNLINYIPFVIAGFIFSFPIYKFLNEKFQNNILYIVLNDILIILLFIFSICILISNSYNPFIYFRF